MLSNPFQHWERIPRFWIPVLAVGLAAGLVAGGNKVMVLPIGAVFGLCGVIILLTRPAWIFWVLVLTVMFNDHLGIPLGGMNVRPYVGLSLLGVGGLFLLAPTGTMNAYIARALRLKWMFLPLGVLIAAKGASWYFVQDQPMGMPKSYPLKHMIFASLLYTSCFATALYTPGRKGLDRAINAWIILSTIACIVGMVQIFASNALGMHWVHQRSVIFYGRPFSWFREPDVFGSMAGATTMLIVPLVLLKSDIMDRRWLWVHLAANGSMLLLLFVRAAWLGAIVAGGFMLLGLLRMRRAGVLGPWIKAGIAGVVVLAMLMPILAPSFAADISDRIGSLANPSEEGASKYRMQDLDAMIETIKPHDPPDKAIIKLLFGHGDMTWSYWAPYIIGNSYDSNALRLLRNHGIVSSHPGFCMAITVLFDNGIVGLSLASLFFIGLFGRVIIRAVPDRSSADVALLLGTAGGVMVLLICFQFSYDPITPFFWVLIGLCAASIDAIDHPEENTEENV